MRLKIQITGLVQGVGFRPFVYRLAEGLGLKGYVLNDSSGVLVEVEGEKQRLDEFLVKIDKDKPRISINERQIAQLSAKPEERFGLSEKKREETRWPRYPKVEQSP